MHEGKVFKILIVEDEPKMASAISQGLMENGFDAEIAHDGAVGSHLALTKEYDLIILDLNLPFMNGMEVCQNIRKKKPGIPIIILTALGAIDDKMKAFSMGADDYVVKPFDFRELLARIKVFLKRSNEQLIKSSDSILQVADLILDVDGKTVTRAGKEIELTAKEFSLLEYFIRNKGRVLSKLDIAEKVWDITFDTGTNVIEVYVNFLRKKIDKDFSPKLIHTRPGLGYILKAEE